LHQSPQLRVNTTKTLNTVPLTKRRDLDPHSHLSRDPYYQSRKLWSSVYTISVPC
jgi:hypothetical protein